MPWAKVDDQFAFHRKRFATTNRGLALWVVALSWCAGQLNDGRIEPHEVKALGFPIGAANDLVSSQLWIKVGAGYAFHDWDEHQPSADETKRKRELSKSRQKRYRDRSSRDSDTGRYALRDARQDDETRVSSTVPDPDPDPVKLSPSTPEPADAAKSTRKRPSKAIPEDWQPNDGHHTKAIERRIDATTEASRFRDHALSKDRRCVDWDAAFRNWLTKAEPNTAKTRTIWDD